MGFAIALNLGGFYKRLPAHPSFSVVFCQRVTVEIVQRKHLSGRQVSIVRDRQNAPAGFAFIVLHVRPKVLGILAVEQGKWQHLIGLVCAVCKNHYTMQVVAFRE